MQDNSWMKCLKPGDIVGIQFGFGGRELATGKIHHITKTGRFVVERAGTLTTFKSDGSERTSGDMYYAEQMIEYTQDVAMKIHRTRVLDKLYHIDWRKVPLDKLDKIWNILQENTHV